MFSESGRFDSLVCLIPDPGTGASGLGIGSIRALGSRAQPSTVCAHVPYAGHVLNGLDHSELI